MTHPLLPSRLLNIYHTYERESDSILVVDGIHKVSRATGLRGCRPKWIHDGRIIKIDHVQSNNERQNWERFSPEHIQYFVPRIPYPADPTISIQPYLDAITGEGARGDPWREEAKRIFYLYCTDWHDTQWGITSHGRIAIFDYGY